jgi:gliding motility-associated-like protein
MIHVTNIVSLEIPNVFSPNKDGINDTYHFNMENITELNLDIFNRWGQLVYQISDIQQSWDGNLSNGNPATDGVYTYLFNAKDTNNKTYEGQGFIHLIR